jgi:hypothetical protein
MAEEISVPIATVMDVDCSLTSLKQEHSELLEQIKTHREHCGEFFDDEGELQDTLAPIEQDPESYVNGTIKTRPILKKYATYLCDKMDLESRIDASAEALRDVNLTPQQVKADMKHYVSLCEKKIASQQALCEQLQEQVKQLTETVSLLATPDKGISKLSMAMNMKLTSVENILLNSHINCLEEKDIFFTTSTKSIEKLLLWGANIDLKRCMHIRVPVLVRGKLTITNKAGTPIELDDTKKHYIPLNIHADRSGNGVYDNITILNIGPYNTNELPFVYQMLGNGGSQERDFIYETTPLKLASLRSSLEMVKFLHEKGAKIGDTIYHTPNGTEGDLVAVYLQTNGSKPVVRF